MSAFFAKDQQFLGKNSAFTQSNSVKAVIEIFLALFPLFPRQKVTFNETISFSGL